MRIKFFSKLGILMLAVFFLMSMVSYSTDQEKGQGKKKQGRGGTPELYKVTISMNNGSPGFETGTCGFENYFYAVGKKGKYLLNLESDGILTPGPEGEQAVPLTMNVKTGMDTATNGPITLENCEFHDGCHGNLSGSNDQFLPEFNNEYNPEYEGIFIRFLKSQDGDSPNQDIEIRWFLDFVPGPKKHGVGWHLHSLRGDFGPGTVISTTLFPLEGLAPPTSIGAGNGGVFETNVEGTFRLLHDGIGLGDYDPTDIDILLHGFNIHLTIERVQ